MGNLKAPRKQRITFRAPALPQSLGLRNKAYPLWFSGIWRRVWYSMPNVRRENTSVSSRRQGRNENKQAADSRWYRTAPSGVGGRASVLRRRLRT